MLFTCKRFASGTNPNLLQTICNTGSCNTPCPPPFPPPPPPITPLLAHTRPSIPQNTFGCGFKCPGCLICKIVLGCSCSARLRGLLVALVGCKISVAFICLPLYRPLVKNIGQQTNKNMENEIAGWPLLWGGFVVVAGVLVVVLDWLGGEV